MALFTALDPWEGMSCTPMSLNGYGYVHGNPTNATDSSGKCLDKLVRFSLLTSNNLFWQPVFSPFFQIGTPAVCSPELPPSRFTEAVNVLAYTAARETGGIGSNIRNDNHAKIALMLMQMNNYRTPTQLGSLGNWRTLGVDIQDPNERQAEFVRRANANAAGATDAERTLAQVLVHGYRTSCSPLASFNSNVALRRFYPDITPDEWDRLNDLSNRFGDPDTALQNEFSIHASRIGDLLNHSAYGSAYPIVPVWDGDIYDPLNRAVIISTSDQTDAPLLWQCPANADAVTPNGNPGVIQSTGSLSSSSNHTCHSDCSFSNYWLYLGSDREAIVNRIGTDALQEENANFARVTQRNYRWVRVPQNYTQLFPSGTQPIGQVRNDYVATCS